ncbi:MAG TPA: glucose-6-phosphate isomerase [Burkholderiales bacterium]|nr:glucose-6-phosphate isomerase [Burkholderiales bacterium]
MNLNTTPPTECRAWAQLAAHAESWNAVHLRELFANDVTRAVQLGADAPGVRLDISRQRVGAITLRLLSQLAEQRGLAEWREALFGGKKINVTEDRAAWHTALRSGSHPEVREVLSQVKTLASKIRTEKTFRRIVNLGTGGSDLGPRLVADALADGTLDVRFAANVDPKDLERALEGAEAETTLFIVVSKTFTTQETMANAERAKAWGGKHFIAVSSNVELAKSFGAMEVLPMWDWVGGRFSVWSAVGLAAMCAIGAVAFQEFLDGAADIDRHFREAPLERNLPVLMAMLGVWNTNFLGAATHAVLPYSNALRLFPPYLQQLEMESNGKRTDREGRVVDYATAPVLWGLEGTVSQHSFHQLLHQGTQAVPVDFIDAGIEDDLSANARAQADALAFGTEDPKLPPHRQYPGNRPSSILSFQGITARNLGRLIALYEHKVFVQGVVWNINSFDQWGVELGKEMARKLLTRR